MCLEMETVYDEWRVWMSTRYTLAKYILLLFHNKKQRTRFQAAWLTSDTMNQT